MNKKGNEFKGFYGGRNYERFAKFFGMNRKFFQNCVGDISLSKGMNALDLGCGTGFLTYELAVKSDNNSAIIGVDISDDQLNFARSKVDFFPCNIDFIKCSMDSLDFPDEIFDVVISSMAFHETPPSVRRKAISEVTRVLKNGGKFILIDWSKPKFGIMSLVWLPFIIFGESNKDNWQNSYWKLCSDNNMRKIEDYYINSLVRRQVFEKKGLDI
ncbi:MAG: class I SAM-dependent methyltransferase [Candidatus Delongbacteria bacterium]|nr:class I SAM-dependent methyltransferase [Candidatus Delongbacteria bacterium]MBN2833480.1 class I SAM-dependent methyltransferase [Candidatus Delongbacteria bacterium]